MELFNFVTNGTYWYRQEWYVSISLQVARIDIFTSGTYRYRHEWYWSISLQVVPIDIVTCGTYRYRYEGWASISSRVVRIDNVTSGTCTYRYLYDHNIENWAKLTPDMSKLRSQLMTTQSWWHTEFDYRYLKWGSRRVWPVSRGCLLLRDTWSYLRIGLCCFTLDFVIAFWIMIAFYTSLTSLFCIR
jgi:hypothetical protein